MKTMRGRVGTASRKPHQDIGRGEEKKPVRDPVT